MVRKALLVVVFLLGLAVGQTGKNLQSYGCTDIVNGYAGGGYNTKICIVYDPNMDKHFIVATSTIGGVTMVEEQ